VRNRSEALVGVVPFDWRITY